MCFYIVETDRCSKSKAVKEVAALMEIKPRTVYGWVKNLKKAP